MSDIVGRLWSGAAHQTLVTTGLVNQAADLIADLRVENDALSRSCAASAANNDPLRAEVEKLRAEVERLKALAVKSDEAIARQQQDLDEAADRAADCDILRAKVERLRAALEEMVNEAAEHHAENVSRAELGGSDMARRKAKAIVSRSGVLLYKIKYIARAAITEETA